MDVKKAMAVMLLAMIFVPMALAAVTVRQIDITGGSKGTNMVITWIVKDTNHNLWKGGYEVGQVRYRPVGGVEVAILTDINLSNGTYCCVDCNASRKMDLNADTTCTYTWHAPNLTNGTYVIDINAGMRFGDASYADTNKDSNSYSIDNRLVTSGVYSILTTTSIVLVAAVILFCIGGILVAKMGGMDVASMLPALIGVLVTLLVLAALYAVLSGT